LALLEEVATSKTEWRESLERNKQSEIKEGEGRPEERRKERKKAAGGLR